MEETISRSNSICQSDMPVDNSLRLDQMSNFMKNKSPESIDYQNQINNEQKQPISNYSTTNSAHQLTNR